MVFALRKPGVDGCAFEGLTTQNRQTCGWSAGGKGGIGDISTIKEDFILPVRLMLFPEPQRS